MLFLRERGVGNVRGACAVQGFDDCGEEAEGGEDAAGVDRGLVGDVIEATGEHEVVGEFVEGTAVISWVMREEWRTDGAAYMKTKLTM